MTRKHKRPTKSRVVRARADCQSCGWGRMGKNALGLAARHHDDTGHRVVARQEIEVTYGHAL